MLMIKILLFIMWTVSIYFFAGNIWYEIGREDGKKEGRFKKDIEKQ